MQQATTPGLNREALVDWYRDPAAGLIELGPTLTYALVAIFGAGGIALLVMFVRSALRVEFAGRGR